MQEILTIIGARPQFIMASVVSREIAKNSELTEIVLHTGQHFDANMSDVFFEEMPDDIKADIIFIDGFHEASQVFRDIINSLNHLSDTGYIIVHDCNPPTKWHTRTYEEYKNTGGDWNGDVYAGYINACKLFGLTYFTVDIDWGVGIIISPKKEIEKSDYKSTIEWDYFNENRKELLNLITIENFKSLFS